LICIRPPKKNVITIDIIAQYPAGNKTNAAKATAICSGKIIVKEAGLKNRNLHGLRKAQGHLLAEMGLSQYEIMSIMGHSTPSASEIYTRNANRINMALSGMSKVTELKV